MEEENYKKALDNRKIPILTLDHLWHQLFGQSRITPEVKELEEQVNALLKRQGKLNTDIRKCKALKKQYMDEIVSLTDQFQETQQKELNEEIETHRRIMDECNQKIEEIKDEMLDIPKEMDQANKELMLRTMSICNERFEHNTEEIKEIDEWLQVIKDELRDKIVKKQRNELDNYGMYTFMHEFFGDETLEIFNMTYDPAQNPPKKHEKS